MHLEPTQVCQDCLWSLKHIKTIHSLLNLYLHFVCRWSYGREFKFESSKITCTATIHKQCKRGKILHIYIQTQVWLFWLNNGSMKAFKQDLCSEFGALVPHPPLPGRPSWKQDKQNIKMNESNKMYWTLISHTQDLK